MPNNPKHTILELEPFTSEQLAEELMRRCKRGVVLMRFDDEDGPCRLSFFEGSCEEVVGILETEAAFQKYADSRDRYNHD